MPDVRLTEQQIQVILGGFFVLRSEFAVDADDWSEIDEIEIILEAALPPEDVRGT